VKRLLILVIFVGLNSLVLPSAIASCSKIPDKPLVTSKPDSSGIDFTVSPATTGCAATQLSFTYSYYDPAGKTWSEWTKWAVGSNTGKAFSFKVPSIKGKSRVAISLTATNKWGTSAVTRENPENNGIGFLIEANTVISALMKSVSGNKSLKFEISHPDSGACSNYLGSRDSYNCSLPMQYRITSEDSTSSFYGNGVVHNEAGEKVGYFGAYTFTDAPSSQWKSTTINISMPTAGKVYLTFTGAGDHHSYTTLSRTFISLTVKSAEQAAAEQAAAAKTASDQAAAAELAAKQRQAAKQLVITCINGKQIKNISGKNPKCPTGYKNPMAGLATFAAFSSCQLYKKDAVIGGAQLKDSGRTLILDGLKDSNLGVDQLTNSDLSCVSMIMKMPSFVSAKIGSTRALDGMQSDRWGKVSTFWNYHPDNGLDISFNIK
jgi:hypothetical protein